ALSRKRRLEQVVGDILSVPGDPGTVEFSPGLGENAMANEYAGYWLDRMVDSPKPMQERMALFWHGHFVSSMRKVGKAAAMREQIDLFRRNGLTDLRRLATEMSLQVAMLKYLDNNRNRANSPNQNFSRELMELFLLGVGNYTEADVEAASLAWTGHSIDGATGTYVWRDNWHDGSPKQFLGTTINRRGDGTQHGPETISVILGDGIVPHGATNAANRGRPTAEVAAEHLSRKLWSEFAGTPPPPAVIAAMRDTAVSSRFSLKPWLTEMFTRPEFYSDEVKVGLVRSPIAAAVATLATTRLGGSDVSLSALDAAGQRPLHPPNVSGWRTNRAWLNASAMTARADIATSLSGKAMAGYHNGDQVIRLVGGDLSRTEVRDTYRDRPIELVARVLELMQVDVTPETRRALDDYAVGAPFWERHHLVRLVMLSPDLHMA
ncbi:MAG: DUF1800 family protein, partial [Ilumatobacteraceae bacterium]